MFDNFSLASLLPKSFTLKNGMAVLCKHIEEHENVKHEVRKFQIRIKVATKAFDVLIWHPGTKKPTYSNDVFENNLYYPVKYELENHSHLYHHDQGGFIVNAIETLVKKETKTPHQCDRVVINYDETLSEIPCEIYVTTDKGEKLKLKHIIK